MNKHWTPDYLKREMDGEIPAIYKPMFCIKGEDISPRKRSLNGKKLIHRELANNFVKFYGPHPTGWIAWKRRYQFLY